MELEGGAATVATLAQRPGQPLANLAFAYQRCRRSALPFGPPNHATTLALLPQKVSGLQQEKTGSRPGL